MSIREEKVIRDLFGKRYVSLSGAFGLFIGKQKGGKQIAEVDRAVLELTEAIDQALTDAGRPSLTRPDASGQPPLDALVEPIHAAYKKSMANGIALQDYLGDPGVPEAEKQRARLIAAGLLQRADPTLAEKTISEITVWAYGRYCDQVIIALWVVARDQGLEVGDVVRRIPRSTRTAVLRPSLTGALHRPAVAARASKEKAHRVGSGLRGRLRALFAPLTLITVMSFVSACAVEDVPMSGPRDVALAAPMPTIAPPNPAPRRSSWPAMIANPTPLYTSPESDAPVLGTLPRGVSVEVVKVAGSRFLVIEPGDPFKPSYVDITNVALSEDAWASVRPPRTATALGVCLGSASVLTQPALSAAMDELHRFGSTFLNEDGPGLQILLRSGFGTSGHILDLALASMPARLAVADPGPEPSHWSGKHAEWKKRKDAYDAALAKWRHNLGEAAQREGSNLDAVQAVRATRTADSAGCLAQLARELRAVAAPTKTMAVLLDPSQDTPPRGASLRNIGVNFLVTCGPSFRACESGLSSWEQAARVSGAMSVRSGPIPGPFLRTAFESVAPVMRL